MKRIQLFFMIGLLLIGTLILYQSRNAAAIQLFSDHLAPQELSESNPTLILQNLEMLNDKVSMQALKSGWLHYAYEMNVNTDRANNGILPNGQDIPLNYILDEWYHIGANRIVVEAVTFMISKDGQIIQTSVFDRGTWQNLTFGEGFEVEPFTPGLFFGFLFDMMEAKNRGSVLSQTSTNFTDQDVWLFTMSEDFDKPLELGSLNQAVKAAKKRGFFDPVSGKILKLETIVVMADDTEQVILQTTPLILEYGVEPPPTVLAYIRK